MDTLAPNHKNNSSSSSGCSTASSTMDIKTPPKCAREQKLLSTRSRSFLHCISKHLGRHFLHHHRRRDAVYNSQEDIRSSSTDSFSLSFERGSHAECQLAGSSIDLTSEERSSRDSSASGGSRCSPPFCALDSDELHSYRHIYVEDMCRPSSALAGIADEGLSSDECNDDEDEENQQVNVARRLRARKSAALNVPTSPASAATTPRSVSSASKAGGLHLSRISITSSVSRMLQHFSATASTRSLSCSSTPLRRSQDTKKHKANGKKSVSSSTSAPASTSAPTKKQDKKQQSILRPPVHYVYMKGMSGLYSRVPRYSVCCPYAMQQFA